MDKLKFMEALGNIDSDLIQEADTVPAKKPMIQRSIKFAGGIAAAAVLAVGAGVYLHAQKPETAPPKTILPIVTQAVTTAETTEQGVIAGGVLTDDDSALCGTYWTNTTDDDSALCGTYWVNTTEPLPPDQIIVAPGMIETAQSSAAASTVMTTQTEASAQTSAAVSTAASEVQKGGIAIEGCAFAPFKANVNPDTDSFQEDEAIHVDIRTADGFYRQLAPAEYQTHGIRNEISASDFGAYIGKITETDRSDYQGNTAESQTPSLRDADVYYYAPAGKNKAFLIVKKDTQCSMFIADRINVSEGFKKGFAFFNVQSADDIQMIEAEQRVPDGNGTFASASLVTVTEPETIRRFYDFLNTLVPEDYSKLPPHIGTPQWLADAWEAYRANPQLPRTDYQITLILTDGTVLQQITYQPYLGNGYVSGMEQLTKEQAETLNALLNP